MFDGSVHPKSLMKVIEYLPVLRYPRNNSSVQIFQVFEVKLVALRALCMNEAYQNRNCTVDTCGIPGFPSSLYRGACLPGTCTKHTVVVDFVE
jgi:hypothetical protein